MKPVKLPTLFIVYKYDPTCINEIKMGLTLAVPVIQVRAGKGRFFLSFGILQAVTFSRVFCTKIISGLEIKM